MSKDSQNPKYHALRECGALYAAAATVKDGLFLSDLFFDPHDLVQVKYEMLRRVRVDGLSVSQAARDFGFSRTAFYQALALWEAQGLPGLIPRRPGPKQAHKLTATVMEFIALEQQRAEESLRADELAERISREFAVTIHPRSIERALSRRRKKGL